MKRIVKSLLVLISFVGLTLGLATAPANAATISGATATSAGEIGTTGTNATPIVVSATLVTVGGAETFFVRMPVGWSFVNNPSGSCSTGQVSSDLAGGMCQAFNWTPQATVIATSMSGNFSSNVTISVTFAANSLNVAAGREFNVKFRDDSISSDVDTGVATLALGTSTPSATPTPTPSASASLSPTPASTAPAKGTAAALATIPKASKAPKLSFDSSSNGLGKSSKKSLKKVATVAKDGYGVRVTGAAGMQAGVSKSAVKALAKKRAMEIRAYLIKQGVPKEDIIIKTKIFPIGKAPSTLVKVETLS